MEEGTKVETQDHKAVLIDSAGMEIEDLLLVEVGVEAAPEDFKGERPDNLKD